MRDRCRRADAAAGDGLAAPTPPAVRTLDRGLSWSEQQPRLAKPIRTCPTSSAHSARQTGEGVHRGPRPGEPRDQSAASDDRPGRSTRRHPGRPRHHRRLPIHAAGPKRLNRCSPHRLPQPSCLTTILIDVVPDHAGRAPEPDQVLTTGQAAVVRRAVTTRTIAARGSMCSRTDRSETARSRRRLRDPPPQRFARRAAPWSGPVPDPRPLDRMPGLPLAVRALSLHVQGSDGTVDLPVKRQQDDLAAGCAVCRCCWQRFPSGDVIARRHEEKR